MKCLPVFLEQIDSIPMSLAIPSQLTVTTNLLHRSTSRIWQIHLFIYRECCYDSKTIMPPSNSDLAMRCQSLMLSCYAPLKAQEIPLDITINHVHITPDMETDVQTLIQDDWLLLAEMNIAGWPYDINDVPHVLCPYYGHRNILTVEDGLILWGEALIIPPSEREKILQAIHEGHMGISICQIRARHCVYWPRINSDIKCLVELCPSC